MTSNPRVAYPAEYYYPEFLENRTDDPRKSPLNPPTIAPASTTASVHEGFESRKQPTVVFRETSEIVPRKSIKNQPRREAQSLSIDIVTNQGLADTDITKAARIDPKKNLIRDPVDRNIPRLIVDQGLLQKSLKTPRLDADSQDSKPTEPFDPTKKPKALLDPRSGFQNGFPNNDFQNSMRKTPNPSLNGSYVHPSSYFQQEKPPVDDFWKKELKINDDGVVSVQPLNYEQELYEGPYGLTREGSYKYYIGLGILAVLGAVFLILTGVFYAQKFPNSSTDPIKIAGMAICGFVFYISIQLILIGIWHQKYRLENPRKLVRPPELHNDSRTHLKTSMETEYNNPDASFGVTNPPYNPNPRYDPPYNTSSYGSTAMNQQTLLQQPGAAHSFNPYDKVVWPTQVEFQPDSNTKFSRPMEYSYGDPSLVYTTGDPEQPADFKYAPDQTKLDKKKNSNELPKPVQAVPAVTNFDNVFPNSTVTETKVKKLRKAPETEDLMKTIASLERDHVKPNAGNTSTGRLTNNRITPTVVGTKDDSRDNPDNVKDRRSRRRRHHRSHRRSPSYSPCSTCSDYSRDDIHSDVTISRYESVTKKKRSQTRSPTHRNSKRAQNKRINVDIANRKGVTIGLEDVPNIGDDRLEQIPVVRRTIIVEPYPEAPSTQVFVKPKKSEGQRSATEINLEDIHEVNENRKAKQSRSNRSKRN